MVDQWGHGFLRLMLEVNKQTDGFVDAYYGPPDIATALEDSPLIPLEDLQTQLDELSNSFEDSDAQRQAFVSSMIRAAKTALRMGDDDLAYDDEARLIFDIEPELVDETRFEEAQAQLSNLLPGEGTVQERLRAYLKHYEMDGTQLNRAIQIALPETRERTANLIDLVAGEGFEYALVKNQVWAAYNWYQGNGQSLIEFNTDVPVNALYILDTCAHEGYPGHHTENMLKEKYLYQDRGRVEHALVLLYSPMAVIAEGIATTALEIIFPGDDADTYLDDVLFPQIGIDPHPADIRSAINKARKNIAYVPYNAAIRCYHGGELSADETVQYIMTHAGSNEERATRTFNFFKSPTSRTYVLTYATGYDLIESASKGEKLSLFKRLLTEPLLPSDLRAMANGT